MQKAIHRAATRGFSERGGLRSWHSFPFGEYANAKRANFGALCVFNDDCFAPGAGVGFHPHENQEMLWLILEGELTHCDDLGHETTLRAGESQLLSAGSGVWHSERNLSSHETRALQIWITPDTFDTSPRYQKRAAETECNRWQTVAAPLESDEARSGRALGLRQNACLALAHLEAGSALNYEMQRADNGVYVFVVEGVIEIAGEVLAQRDAMQLRGCGRLEIEACENADVIVVEVPQD